jgi:glycosyltransferase involved in cell wall biosynthesis
MFLARFWVDHRFAQGRKCPARDRARLLHMAAQPLLDRSFACARDQRAPIANSGPMQQPRDQFHILSFEGPDPYARAGGIATRITGLTRALAEANFDTHLWFVGDPALPGEERDGSTTLHRWCQWISHYHPAGVYDGEAGKVADYAQSLPPLLWREHLLPAIASGARVVVLAEEWQTASAVIHLDALLRAALVRDRVTLLWNANNTFGFEQIDWPRLQAAATLTTVSRYMKHKMSAQNVDPLIIPNGLGEESFVSPDPAAVHALSGLLSDRLLLAKVARWDPDKRWLLAVDTVAELKGLGKKPLLVARGGKEAHGHAVMERARQRGLHIVERSAGRGERGLLGSLADAREADIIVLESHLDPQARAVLLRGADAVLANSSHEPFGLVGLETMAVGGLACTGASGEDYAVDGENALVLQTNDPHEFVALYGRARDRPGHRHALRAAAMHTARQYAWPRVLERSLIPRLSP